MSATAYPEDVGTLIGLDDDEDSRSVLRLLRLRKKAEAIGNTVRVAQLDWCISWIGFKRYSKY